MYSRRLSDKLIEAYTYENPRNVVCMVWFQWSFDVSVTIVDRNEVYQGSAIDILQELTRRLNFRYVHI